MGHSQLDALSIARQAEDKAARFYTEAAEKCSDPRGKNLFLQLAEFERTHSKKLDQLIDSLSVSEGYVEYDGTELVRAEIETPAGVVAESGDVLDIISQAIEAERNAKETYEKLAQETDDPLGKDMFNKLAQEEAQHERLLNDQFYSLSNLGYWVWGE